jgi:4-amino-4-deoxy-L-arabinose transferase-like glycosyltransferase
MEKTKVKTLSTNLLLLPEKIKTWISHNKKEFILLTLILAIGAFFRLYRISEYMTFLGDEGRDAIVVRRLLVNFDPILIGPGTSIGNMYLGPLYYYMMAPALLLANFSPVGPAVMVALLGVATIFFVWYIGRLWFGKTAAITSSLLYAFSPVVIIYSRSSWNPNIMPFFALLTIFSIWKVWKEQKFKWLIILGASFAFTLQSHYLALLLAPTIIMFWILTFLKIRNSRLVENWRLVIGSFLKNSLLGLFIFAVLMSPLVIFDIRHGGRNFNAIKTFFSQRESTVSIKPWKAIPNIYPIMKDDYVTRIITGGNTYAGKITSFVIGVSILLILISLAYGIIVDRKISDKPNYLIVAWIIFGLVGFGLYKQHIYDHYFGFMMPAGFLLLGGILQYFYEKFKDDGKIFAVTGTLLLIIVNFTNNPLRYPPNKQMERATTVARLIQEEAKGKNFNFAVIAESNYEDGYKYFLERSNAPVIDIDAQKLDKTITDQLFVVCEMPEDKCDPTHNAKAEVANFGWSKIDGEWKISGVTIYRLVHTK